MLGIGKKIKKDFVFYILKYVKRNFSIKVYSFFLFLSVIRKFKKETNKPKKNNNFKIHNIDNISSDVKMLWVICYEPVMNFDCSISSDKQISWILNETKKLHLLNVKLYEIRN